MNKFQVRNKKLYELLNEFKTNDLDIKATCNQINNLFKTPIVVKCYHDNTVAVYGILQNNRPIRYNYNVFSFIEKEKDAILKWVSPWEKYQIKPKDSEKEVLSSFSIYSLELNKMNTQHFVVKIDADSVDNFEHEEISPFFLRLNLFMNLLKNIEYINKRINNYYKFDSKEESVEDVD